MKVYVGVTDFDWFTRLSTSPSREEVNFWQPGGNRIFRVLAAGELFLFKLHSPQNFIVGGGLFAHASILPISLAWAAFGTSNGVSSLADMRTRTARYRRTPPDPRVDFNVGCIVLTQPFFLPRERWVAVPNDWSPNIVQGKSYDLSVEPGATLLNRLRESIGGWGVRDVLAPAERYGEPTLTRPRLGQGAFRILVTDAYDRRCSITGERVLPVLEAAHVKPYSVGGEHEVANGLLLRSDIHTLFDRGYVTVTPDRRVEISRRIRDDFSNGRDYYALHGAEIRLPQQPEDVPKREYLSWHNNNVYLG